MQLGPHSTWRVPIYLDHQILLTMRWSLVARCPHNFVSQPEPHKIVAAHPWRTCDLGIVRQQEYRCFVEVDHNPGSFNVLLHLCGGDLTFFCRFALPNCGIVSWDTFAMKMGKCTLDVSFKVGILPELQSCNPWSRANAETFLGGQQ